MTIEEQDTEPMGLTGLRRHRQGDLWWKAAIGLLLSGALILVAVWVRLEARSPESLFRPLAPSPAFEEADAPMQPRPVSQPRTLTLRLPADL